MMLLSGKELTEQLNLTWLGTEFKNILEGVTIKSGRSLKKMEFLFFKMNK